ncbi:MAG: Tox-REase-5 domain-containing protein, partial [Cutibacterium avidum]|nr:Tox-REase-5 domain-containing protein [Cutibacterium avidum]
PFVWTKTANEILTKANRPTTSNTGHYYVNGVEFDGFQNGELLDAKGLGYANLIPAKWSTAAKQLRETARRQLKAAGSTPIHWIFAEEEAAREAREIISAKINISHVPCIR